jgi:hypothetical protein
LKSKPLKSRAAAADNEGMILPARIFGLVVVATGLACAGMLLVLVAAR